MIQLLEGPPRSGKTYFCVNYLCKFTTYDALYNEYILQPDVLIISNIEGLKINHWRLDECLQKQSLEEFFTIVNFEKIMSDTGKRHVIIAIDECHDYFPNGYKNDKIYSFFAYHGHIGLDIILMCQSLDRTSRMFNPLLERVVKVTPRSKAILKNLSYSSYALNGTYMYSETLAKKKEIFNAYQSYRQDEKNKPKNAIKHWVVIISVLLIGSLLLFKSAFSTVKSKSETARVRQQSQQKNVTTATPGASSPVLPVVQHSYSAVREPLPAFVPEPVFVGWRTYPVDGYIRDGQKVRYMVHGKILDPRYCRNYSDSLKQVEFYGPSIPESKPSVHKPVDLINDKQLSSVVAEMRIDDLRSQVK